MVPFNGVVQDRHKTSSGSDYVRITFGLPEKGSRTVEDPSDVIDAEFVFLEGRSRSSTFSSRSCAPEQPGGCRTLVAALATLGCSSMLWRNLESEIDRTVNLLQFR